jgi:t-SNARE complex subunit (syntaxin)
MSETLQILEIEKDILCIRDMHNDLNEIAMKQNIKLDSLETNIMDITTAVMDAESDMSNSDDYNKKNIKNTIYASIATSSILTYLLFGTSAVIPIGVFAMGSYIIMNRLN